MGREMGELNGVKIEDIPEIVIYFKKKNFEIRDLAVIAIDIKNNEIASAGRKAIEYVKEHQETILFVPFKNGRIIEMTPAMELVKYLIKQSGMRRKLLFYPKILVAMPVKLAEVDKKAYEDMLLIISSKKGDVIEADIEHIKVSEELKYDIAFGLIKNWVDEVNTDNQINSITIYSEEREMLISEPLIMAINKNTRKAVAVGREALQAKETGNDAVEYICPFNNKVVTDFDYGNSLIKFYLIKAEKLVKRSLRRQNIMLCNIPKDITQVEEYAYTKVFGQSGKYDVTFEQFPYAKISKSLDKENNLKVKFFIEINESFN